MRCGTLLQRTDGLDCLKSMSTLLKLKQESAGWPADCVTPEQQEAYLADYEAHEGIKLKNVADNPGQKVIAKMLLNR